MDLYSQILELWFEGVTDEVRIDKKVDPYRKWFSSDPEFDQLVKNKYQRELANQSQSFEVPDSAEQNLALVILFDQFTRQIYRNSQQAYQYDDKAILLAQHCIKNGLDKQLMLIQRLFVYMPYMHAEDVELQRESVVYFENLCNEAQERFPHNADYYKWHLGYAQKHLAIISEHGYFPHRKKIRPS